MSKRYHFNPLLWISLFALVPLHGMEINHVTKEKSKSARIVIVQGDITKQTGLDVIVNAANEQLAHAGGVAAAIRKAAGDELQAHCTNMPNWPKTTVKTPTGEAVITPAFDLETTIKIEKIIHAVGPNLSYRKKDKSSPSAEDALNLHNAYTNSLKIAVANNLRRIGFPSISTKIFAYDINLATPIAIKAIMQFIEENPTALDEVRLILFSPEDYAVFKQELDKATHQVEIQKPIGLNKGIAYHFCTKPLTIIDESTKNQWACSKPMTFTDNEEKKLAPQNGPKKPINNSNSFGPDPVNDPTAVIKDNSLPWKWIGGSVAAIVVIVAAKKLYNWWYPKTEPQEEIDESKAQDKQRSIESTHA